MKMKMTDQYVAGFFDGEGCLRIDRHRRPKVTYYSPRVILGQKYREVLEEIRHYLGIGEIHDTVKGHFTYRIGGQEDVRKFCAIVGPYLLVKIDQLRLMNEFLLTKGNGPLPEHKSFYERMKALNSGRLG